MKIVYFSQLLVFALIFNSTLFTAVSAQPMSFAIPASIQEKIETLRSFTDQNSKARVLAFDQLISELTHLQFLSQRESLKKSDLTDEKLNMMRENSKGIFSLREFMDVSAEVKNGYSLGLSSRYGIYQMLSERYELKGWDFAYHEFEINWRTNPNHTSDFLSKVQETNLPVVFFVPNKTFSHPEPSITIDELKWYFADQKRMKNVYFVFGAYDLVTEHMESLREDAGLSRDMFRSIFMRALGAKESSWDYRF